MAIMLVELLTNILLRLLRTSIRELGNSSINFFLISLFKSQRNIDYADDLIKFRPWNPFVYFNFPKNVQFVHSALFFIWWNVIKMRFTLERALLIEEKERIAQRGKEKKLQAKAKAADFKSKQFSSKHNGPKKRKKN